MRTAAFCSWFVPLFVLYIVIVVGYNAAAVYRREAAERKAQQERERIAAEKRKAKEMRKQKNAEARRKAIEAAKQERAAIIAAQPKKKRGRPRKNPPAEASEPKKRGRPCINPPAELLHADAIPETEPNVAKTGAFAGETVAFTGSCPKLQRRYMISHTERLGGKGYETINTRCTLLVVGEKPGKNQLEKAERWNVPTITWEEWWQRAFASPAVVKPQISEKPQITAPALVTLEQFAAIVENAA